MRRLRKLILRFGGLFNKQGKDRELDQEIESHLQMHIEDNLRLGMTPEEARRQAMIKLGGIESTKEAYRDQRGLPALETLWQDIRYGARMLRKNPGFTIVAVLTLAFGIGANTAIFSFVNSILLRPLPYKDPKRLVMVFENNVERGWNRFGVGAPILHEWRRQSSSFEGLAARGWDNFTFTGKAQPESLKGSRVSANMFSVLGVNPILGRDFLPEEETYGKHHVVILSHELWQRRFGGESSIVGQSLTVNDEPHTVIGVMPAKTFFPEAKTELWTPMAFSPEQLSSRHAHSYHVYGRLKPGVTLAQARAEMDLVAQRMATGDQQNKGWGVTVDFMQEVMVGASRRVLMVLLAAVGLVLLICCANIANLLLARSAARSREFAIRAALGAGRGHMIRQLLTESLVLSICGAGVGIALAAAGLKALLRLSPPDLPRMWEGIQLDGWTLGFTGLITLVTGLVFGLAPAWQASKPSLITELNEASRGSSSGRHRQRVRAALVISEVALSLTLLVGAGLMIRSFSRLVSQPLGFNPEHIVSMDVNLTSKKYSGRQTSARFFELFLAQVQALPGVESAALVFGLPLSGGHNELSVVLPEMPPPTAGSESTAGYAQISPGYFKTMHIPILKGRDFTDQDRTNTPPVLIVDETFAKNFKLGTNVLGRRIRVGDDIGDAEIIGVVKDIKRSGLADAPSGEMYRTFLQANWGSMSLVARTHHDPVEVTRAVRAVLDGLDKDQPIENVRTMTQLIESNVAQRRLSTRLLGAFAGAAMLLAALGLYGVLAYNVAQRTQEIGIRVALGAQKWDVLWLVIRQGIRLALVGMSIGIALALALTKGMQRLLFEVEPTDPFTFVIVSVLLLGVTFLACWLPARRAAKVDPIVALRYE